MCTKPQTWHTGEYHAANQLANRTFCGLLTVQVVRTICTDHQPDLYAVSCGACKRTNAYKACVTEAALGWSDHGLQGIMNRHADRVLGDG